MSSVLGYVLVAVISWAVTDYIANQPTPPVRCSPSVTDTFDTLVGRGRAAYFNRTTWYAPHILFRHALSIYDAVRHSGGRHGKAFSGRNHATLLEVLDYLHVTTWHVHNPAESLVYADRYAAETSNGASDANTKRAKRMMANIERLRAEVREHGHTTITKRVEFLETQLNGDIWDDDKWKRNEQDGISEIRQLCLQPASAPVSSFVWINRTVDVLSVRSPRAFRVHGFLSDAEADEIVRLAKPHLHNSVVVTKEGKSIVSTFRTSRETYIADSWKPDVVDAIEARIIQFANVSDDYLRGEALHVLRYATGGKYGIHKDFFNIGNPTHAPLFATGQRWATMLIYLNTMDVGGATVFPRANLVSRPRKGDALFFHDLLDSTTGVADDQLLGDWMTVHGACPVIKQGAEKWVVTKWLRTAPLNAAEIEHWGRLERQQVRQMGIQREFLSHDAI